MRPNHDISSSFQSSLIITSTDADASTYTRTQTHTHLVVLQLVKAALGAGRPLHQGGGRAPRQVDPRGAPQLGTKRQSVRLLLTHSTSYPLTQTGPSLTQSPTHPVWTFTHQVTQSGPSLTQSPSLFLHSPSHPVLFFTHTVTQSGPSFTHSPIHPVTQSASSLSQSPSLVLHSPSHLFTQCGSSPSLLFSNDEGV